LPEATGKRHALQRFEMVTVHRLELKNAPYNPRVLTDAAKRKLKKGLGKHGLLSPLTWNARTGNLVSGHQRLSILDAEAGTQDYTLDVARVELDDRAEREANILFNNAEASGDWDLGKLSEMMADQAIDIDGTGFDAADVYRLFGDSPLAGRGQMDELAEKLRDAAKSYDKAVSKQERGSQDFYLVVVFRDDAERTAFLTELGLEENRFQDGRALQALLTAARSK
jgi:hypothetical protein